MSHEIVPADSILDQETDGSSSSNHTYERFYDASSSGAYDYEANAENEETPYTFTRTRSLTYGRQHVPESFDSERLPAFLASGIHKFLLVANLLESEEPRVAYLCRFQAFEIAHRMDRNSTARGVRQFKTSLLQRLEQDEYTTLDRRKEETDTRELRRVYHAYKDYIFRNSGALNLEGSERERLINARRIASVLYEVLKTVTNAVDPQALADRDSIPNKPQFYVPYNILPLDQGGIQQPIMQLPEIKAAIAAVRNTRGLPSGPDFQKSGAFMDLFDFLHYCFGFQEGNVANQRENLILLLANIHIRQSHKQSPISELGDAAVDELMRKFFKNYTNWSKFLGRRKSIRLPCVKQEAQQHKILYLGLYLLIWGEAANLRFMPECLCYIFHHMAYELHGILTGAVSTITGEKIMPAYGGAFESFLKNVVTPIYRVIYEEAQKSKNGTADHSKWRNYDDLNEFFWSTVCFEIGWPMRLEHDFFWVTNNRKAKNATVPRDAVKEKNKGEEKKDEEQGVCSELTTSGLSLHHPYSQFSYDFFSPFQAMIIMACHDLESPLQVFDADVFEDIMSIFITSAILKLIQAIFDIAFTWKARRTMESSRKRKYMFKLFVAVIWTIVLPVLYAITIYLMSNAIELVLFFVPTIGKYIEISNWRICTMLSWWTQIKPLIEPTRLIMKIGVQRYDWHELFPKVKSNAGAIVAVWSPIIVVYFMDTQIWYSVFCTIFGGLYGILHHLGEIRTLGMLRSRFHTLPSAFNVCLIPPALRNDQKNKRIFFRRFHKGKKDDIAKFVLVWNQIVNRFRVEDLISNRELDLMTIPMSKELFSGIVRWPIFLLAHKFVTALSIARDFVGKDKILFRKIRKDKYMYSAVKECYESLKCILEILVVGDLEKRVISNIVNEIEESIGRSNLLDNFKMSELLALQAKCIELVELLVEGNETHHDKVVKVLQDIFELVTNDMMTNGSRVLDSLNSSQLVERDFAFCLQRTRHQLFADKNSIHFPLPDNDSLNEQIKRFLLLLSVKDKAMDIPANLEARRRISFFATSLFMGMPSAPKVRNMLSFSVLTPHFTEDINFSMKELYSSKEEVSIIFYMQKIYPDEWKNFLERMGCENLDTLKDEGKEEELRSWASFRGQTLSRSVRGMMYYEEALKLQAFLDMAEDEDILEGYEAAERNNRTLFAQLDALSDMKFTYVVSCQMFGSQKASGDPRAQDMIDLMIRYPSLRVAYVEETEVFDANKPRKVYSSILVKGVNGKDPGAEEIYRIKLPGPPNIGEGKPENQNHAVIFTRGEALQTIDMNQDNYLEEALKMRNLLQEFLQNHGRRPPTILGLREHIFTGSVSSLAWFMSYQETSFVTIGQRLLANPLRVRFHYGHPDVFDRVFHITRGFNCTLRRGCITYHEYIQVGKGRDVGLNQISKFEAKVANGNSEQTLSRDIHRLGRRFDFFRMLSCYFTTIGFYFSSMLYLVLSGLQKALMIEAKMRNIQSSEAALASQSFIQLGLLTGLPMVMEIGLEKGFLNALKDFVLMQLQLAALFFTFSLGSKTHYYGRTILHGGAKYRPTGRKVVVFHASFTENYRLYSRSHFVKGFELLLLLIVYDLFRRSYQSNMAYVFITYSIWFMSITWLFAPFLFNPSGFSWGKIVDDWKDWNKWIRVQGGIGIPQDKSWHSWWIDEQAHLHRSGLGARLFEILLSLRFFIYQYGLVYHLDISQQSKNFLVYVLSWIVILAVFLTVKIAQAVRPKIENTGLWDFVKVLAKAYDYGMGVVLFTPIAVLAWLPIISAFQTRFLFNEAFNRHLQIQPILAGKKKHR
ncbi:putative callose synthase 8 [Citrus sinensis]|uniref:Callose synthase 8 n=1 Tax=Citrus sinensis TaxID=2711 RepID=A0ACB8M1T0_CITSI|nr:putative callose synthase 8 [Citrus sinensis]